MSFSYNVKEELSKINIFNNEKLIKSQLLGYLLTANANIVDDKIEYITENEFNIELLYKMLFKLNFDYEPEKEGKVYKATLVNKENLDELKNLDLANDKEIVRGAFLGAGTISEPKKGYHLEIIFKLEENANLIKKLCELKDLSMKIMENKNKFILYLKDGEEISKFLAYIGANQSVLKFEENRVIKEMKNSVNRRVNCETANINRIVEASLSQVNDIKLIMEKNKFEELSKEVKDVAIARLEHPDDSIKDLSKYLENRIGKSGINYRLKKIHELAEEIRNEE